MNASVHIEPGPAQRGRFALWCLSQDPQIQTASHSGFDVPLALYPDVPTELLDGSYVDGFLYGHQTAAPAPVEAPTPAPADDAVQSVAEGVPEAEPVTALDAVVPKTSTRRRKDLAK